MWERKRRANSSANLGPRRKRGVPSWGNLLSTGVWPEADDRPPPLARFWSDHPRQFLGIGRGKYPYRQGQAVAGGIHVGDHVIALVELPG